MPRRWCASASASSAGQAVGLLQIGPLLLPVTAPLAGVVAAVLAAEGHAVGYGTALVELQRLE